MTTIKSIPKVIRDKGLGYFFRAAWTELMKKGYVTYIDLAYRGDRASYSQYKEDLWIDRMLGYKKNGFYIDIGASDPNYLNNTKKFYEKGWKGLNVEPNPSTFRKLKEDRDRDINLNVGVGLNPGE